MGRAVTAAILGAAVLGFFIGAWAISLVSPDDKCVTTATQTTCTVYAHDPARQWLVGGVPTALLMAGLAFIIVRWRFANRNAKPS